jgi:hypothetical protein
MSGAGDWGTDKARNRLQKDTPGQKVGEEKMEPFKLDGRTKAFKEKVKKLAYSKKKLNAQAIKLIDPKNIENPLKGYPYNERMTKEHSEELMAFVKNANEAGVEPTELMDAVENWMAIKGYTQVKEESGLDEEEAVEEETVEEADLRAKRESKDMQSFSQFNEAKVTMAKLKPGMTFEVIHKGRSARNFGVNGENVYGGKVKVLGMGNVPFKKKAEKKHVFAKDMKDAQNKFRDIWNKEEIRYGYFGSSLGRIKAFFNAIAAESEGKKIPYGHTCWIWEVIEGENKGFISYCFISFDEKWEVVFLNKATEFELIS